MLVVAGVSDRFQELGVTTHAANILGISIRTLRNKLNEYADGGLPITPAGSGDYGRVAAAM